MPTQVGKLGEFDPSVESLSAYLERLHLYFDANEVSDARKVPVLLSLLSPKHYALLRDLIPSPDLPKEKSLDELKELLKQLFEPKRIVIAERFYFHRRNQLPNESISQYVSALRNLATHCDFKDQLSNALRDRLVCGLRSDVVQKRLLAEENLTFKDALKIAQGMEAAHQSAQTFKGEPTAIPVHKLAKPCYRCGRSNHNERDCKFREAECHNCHK